MAAERYIQFRLPDEAGKPVNVRLFASKFDDFVAGILRVAATVPQPPALTVDIPIDPDPVSASAIDISQIYGSPDQARLSIGIGPISLQVAVPLGDLRRVLEVLMSETEPDKTSPHRPN